MDIRPLVQCPELWPELAQLHHEAWQGADVATRCRVLAGFKGDALPLGFVAVDGTVLCGSAFLMAADLSIYTAATPWLAGVYVKAAYRGRKVATRLIEHVMAAAVAMGFKELFLYTDEAETLYLGLGWQTIKRTHYRGMAISIMRRDLP
ncbi:MAG: GNAT family N-acetyltransferase [Neisseriaceae bacterium]|nr:GNAT family N-acetyltransferase [Neisseriaceae bacterium]